jgi:hypothetical protein
MSRWNIRTEWMCGTHFQAQILVGHGKYVGNKEANGQEKHDDQTVN